MDASPLAQLNNRQMPFVISPIEDHSPLWEASQQNQQVRPNPLQRGPFARAYSSSFGSISSSASSNYTNASSAPSTGSGYFDLNNQRSKGDLLSPMASLTADMSANFSLDPRYSLFLGRLLTAVLVQDFPPPDVPFYPHYPSALNLEEDSH